MMLVVGPEHGGTVTLYRKDVREGESEEVELDALPNRLVIFRTDTMGYQYAPNGANGLVVQAWCLQEAPELEVAEYKGPQNEIDQLMGLENGPRAPLGNQLNIMSCMVRLAGDSYGLDHYWLTIVSACDCGVELPFSRY